MAWMLAGAFLMVAVVAALAYFDARRYLQREIERLRRENETLMRTAFEARGVQVVSAPEPQQREMAVTPLRAPHRIASKLLHLEMADAQRARERDERIAAEIEEQRKAEGGSR